MINYYVYVNKEMQHYSRFDIILSFVRWHSFTLLAKKKKKEKKVTLFSQQLL